MFGEVNMNWCVQLLWYRIYVNINLYQCLRNLYANVLTQINAIGCHVQANQKLVKTALQPFFLSHAVHTKPILFGTIWLFTFDCSIQKGVARLCASETNN